MFATEKVPVLMMVSKAARRRARIGNPEMGEYAAGSKITSLMMAREMPMSDTLAQFWA